MKINIVSDNENKALERRDLIVEIEHPETATPSRAQIQQAIAKQVKANAENVEVLSIFTGEGRNVSKTEVKVWKNKTVDVAENKPQEVPAEEASKETSAEEESSEDDAKEEAAEAPAEEEPEEEKDE